MAQNLKKKKLPLVFSLLISSSLSLSLPSFLPLFQKKVIKGDKGKCFVVIVRKKDTKKCPILCIPDVFWLKYVTTEYTS